MHSLRWHYPDQVIPVGDESDSPSQPGFPELPVTICSRPEYPTVATAVNLGGGTQMLCVRMELGRRWVRAVRSPRLPAVVGRTPIGMRSVY